MNFDEYQRLARQTAIYPDRGNNYIYPTLGLVGEAGEIAEKIKKIIRDNNGNMTIGHENEIGKELGDVLWYVANLAVELGLSLDRIAQSNVNKLQDRQQRNKLHGSGDNR